MRTIKFRAKNLDGEWGYGCYVEEERQTLNGFEKKYFIVNDGYDYVKPETVGQFMGLHDKDGKEIYEGDLIEVDDRLFGIVEWHKDGYFFINDTCPNISEQEWQYCCLSMMEFDSNAEAKLLNINTSSVRTKRLRLRQKLNLTLGPKETFCRYIADKLIP